MRRSRRFAAMVLPALLGEMSEAAAVAESVLGVLTELVDVTARHRASVDLAGRISCDGVHVLLTVGEMDRPLPDPEVEPGLYLVHRLVATAAGGLPVRHRHSLPGGPDAASVDCSVCVARRPPRSPH